jgi:hypothetical protein
MSKGPGTDTRDIRSGTYDAINPAGRQQPHQVSEAITPHQAAQGGADVRPEPLAGTQDPVPEGLIRPRKGPLSPRRGRTQE